jgi:VWFA-related protein
LSKWLVTNFGLGATLDAPYTDGTRRIFSQALGRSERARREPSGRPDNNGRVWSIAERLAKDLETILMRQLALALPLAAATAWIAAQEQPPSFRAGIELVQLDVSVLDDTRQPVRGLTEADFTVLENGKPRPIRAFSAVDLPARNRGTEAVWTGSVPPDVGTNEIGQQDGRLVIILMDRSMSSGDPVATAKKVATAAVENLGPHDLAALVTTSGGVPQTLTADRPRLIKAINQRDWSAYSDPNEAQTQNPAFTLSSAMTDGRCLCGLCVLETITRVSDAVREAPRRRKLLLFIGSGIALMAPTEVKFGPPTGDIGCDRRLGAARQVMLSSLALSNLTIHSIDPKGLVNIGPATKAGLGGAKGGPDTAGPRQRIEMQQKDTVDHQDLQGTLRYIAARTGGRAVINANNPDERIPDILRESDAYYVIGFDSGMPGQAEDRRTIEVKTRRKGVRVYTQRQYVVPAANPGAAAAATAAQSRVSAETALAGLLPAPGRPLALAVSAFASETPGKASVRITVDAGAFSRRDGTVPLEIRTLALDQTAHRIGGAQQTSTIEARRTPDDRSPIADIQTYLDLDPGDYEIRAAVADQARGTAASVFQPLAIPSFADAPLSLSHVAIETGTNANGVISPTTQRTFSRTDQPRVFFQIYQGTQRTDPIVPVTVRVRVLDASGTAVRDQSLPFTDKEFRDRRADCRINLPIPRLAAGDYALRIDVSSEKQTAGRAIRFSVH